MMKYLGQYRLKADATPENDFPRIENGTIDPSYDDIYIKCKNESKIFHYGGSMLQAYIPSIKRANRIIKELGSIVIEPNKNDSEVTFLFNAKNLEVVADKLGANTVGSSISPFSKKNLKRIRYQIPEEDAKRFKKSVEGLEVFDIKNILKQFETKFWSKKDIADRRKTGLSNKDYIHYRGKFDDLISLASKYKEEHN